MFSGFTGFDCMLVLVSVCLQNTRLCQSIGRGIDSHLVTALVMTYDSLPKGKSLDVTKLKAFADETLNVARMMISLFDRVENTGKR